MAQLIGALMRVAPRASRIAAAPSGPEPIRRACCCYDHLADGLGTGLLAVMRRKGWLTDAASALQPKALLLSPRGEKALAALGLDLDAARSRSQHRQFACTCLDWSERRDHLGRALGTALAARFTQLHWIERKTRARVVQVTVEGAAQFKHLGFPARG